MKRTHDGQKGITTFEAFWILGYYWRVICGRHGIGLPYVIAFWRYYNFGTTNWYPNDDRERVRVLYHKLEDYRQGEVGRYKAGHRNFHCHRTDMIVYGVKDENMDHFDDWITEPNRSLGDTMDYYDFKAGPSNTKMKFGPITMADISIFNDCITWYRTRALRVVEENEELKEVAHV